MKREILKESQSHKINVGGDRKTFQKKLPLVKVRRTVFNHFKTHIKGRKSYTHVVSNTLGSFEQNTNKYLRDLT